MTPTKLANLVLTRSVVSVSGGTASVTGRPTWTGEEIAELVYTLTQLPGIDNVSFPGHPRLTRADEEAYAPPILIESPANRQAIASRRIQVSGSAKVFEATVMLVLNDGQSAPIRKTVTATAGAPDRGTFDVIVNVSKLAHHVTLIAYSPSAENGSPQHETQVQFVITAP